ncbi:hypothetical protein [Halomicrococcus gelatinilyticus]|uniref:hypothetical protein n=1 Tax=Halomicrococcus gelatinilyticus TaxID=1702103 RepID=UPI002E1614DC
MKSGASDPFSDDVEEDDADPASTSESTPASDDGSVSDETDVATGGHTSTTDESVTSDSNTRINREDLPLTLRRDNVKDERDSVHQLFVQSATDERAKDAERDLESLVGEDVYRLDAREAIYLAGMQNIEDAATILRDWGYDL